MKKNDYAVNWAINIASDDKHGYDQIQREGPDYDCSSFIINAWEQAKVPVKRNGASYTGNMYSAFLQCGFIDVKDKINILTGQGLILGDVLLNVTYHTAMYIGNGNIVQASINENNNTILGKTGDQTRKEIYIRPYYLYNTVKGGWNHILRYIEDNSYNNIKKLQSLCNKLNITDIKGNRLLEDGILGPLSIYAIQQLPVLSIQCELRVPKSKLDIISVKFIQNLLHIKCDGIFGIVTYNSVICFQENNNLKKDGIIGPNTWLAFAKI